MDNRVCQEGHWKLGVVLSDQLQTVSTVRLIGGHTASTDEFLTCMLSLLKINTATQAYKLA